MDDRSKRARKILSLSLSGATSKSISKQKSATTGKFDDLAENLARSVIFGDGDLFKVSLEIVKVRLPEYSKSLLIHKTIIRLQKYRPRISEGVIEMFKRWLDECLDLASLFAFWWLMPEFTSRLSKAGDSIVTQKRKKLTQLTCRLHKSGETIVAPEREKVISYAARLDRHNFVTFALRIKAVSESLDLAYLGALGDVLKRAGASKPDGASLHPLDLHQPGDDTLLAAWPDDGRGYSIKYFSKLAARCGENLTRSWIKTYLPQATIVDLSIRQVFAQDELDPMVIQSLVSSGVAPELCKGRSALPADVAVINGRDVVLIDTKHTIKRGPFMDFFLRGDKLELLENKTSVSFVGTWTSGSLEVGQWRKKQEEERPEGGHYTLSGKDVLSLLKKDVPHVRTYIIGIVGPEWFKRFRDFMAEAAPGISLNIDSQLGRAARGKYLLPHILQVPHEAYSNRDQTDRRDARRAAEMLASLGGTHGFFPAMIGSIGRTYTSETPGLTLALYLGRRLSKHLDAPNLPIPSTGMVYVLLLQAFLDTYDLENTDAVTDALPRAILAEGLGQLLSNLDGIGLWDPSSSLRGLVKALRAILLVDNGLSRLPRFNQIAITARGTVIAKLTQPAASSESHDQRRPTMTLLAQHCSEYGCNRGPLLYGETLYGRNCASTNQGLSSGHSHQNGCARCGILLCREFHGCRKGLGYLLDSSLPCLRDSLSE